MKIGAEFFPFKCCSFQFRLICLAKKLIYIHKLVILDNFLGILIIMILIISARYMSTSKNYHKTFAVMKGALAELLGRLL